jgi:hypothetical protein
MAEHETEQPKPKRTAQTKRSRLPKSQRPPRMTGRCKARSKRTGARCGAVVEVDGQLCRWHGAATQGGAKFNARVAWEAAVAKAESTYDAGFDFPDSPEDMLLADCRRSASALAFLQLRIARLDERDLFDPSRPGHAEASTLHEMYMREREHSRRVADTAIKCGVSLKRVQLEQDRARLVVRAINGMHADPRFQLTAEQRSVAPALAQEHLALVSAQAAIDVEGYEDEDGDDD